jgi:hypothetical protein
MRNTRIVPADLEMSSTPMVDGSGVQDPASIVVLGLMIIILL